MNKNKVIKNRKIKTKLKSAALKKEIKSIELEINKFKTKIIEIGAPHLYWDKIKNLEERLKKIKEKRKIK